MAFDTDDALLMRNSSRANRLPAMLNGSYVMAVELHAGTAVRFSCDEGGTSLLEIDEFESVSD
jgi:hypothetical protein